MQFHKLIVHFASLAMVCLIAVPAEGQIASRPVEEWIKTLDGPQRVADMKIGELVAALKLQPGQTVADIGAGTGLLVVPLANAVGARGRVFAVEFVAGFFPQIRKRVDAAGVKNVDTVLGKFTDPALPVRTIDVALFHDVIHHVQERASYIKTLAGYLAPTGRIVVIDYEPARSPHSQQPELQVSREQLIAWMKDAGLTQIEDVKLFTDKYFLAFAKR